MMFIIQDVFLTSCKGTVEYTEDNKTIKEEYKQTCSKVPKCVKLDLSYNEEYFEEYFEECSKRNQTTYECIEYTTQPHKVSGTQCPIGNRQENCQAISGMHCKKLSSKVKGKGTKTTYTDGKKDDYENNGKEQEFEYEYVGEFGDRTDAIILLITTLLFGIVMVVFILLYFNVFKCGSKQQQVTQMQ